jgi:phage terminase large subunit-like protein
MQEHPVYGWRPEWKNGVIVAVHFNSGVSIYFKTYAMDPQDLQTGSVDALFLDEECPEELLAELHMRLVATGGYFHAVFTPTLGQEVWRRAFEERGKKNETYVTAFKQQVSMYDCLFYEDGTRSHWTVEAIERAKNSCKSDAQVQRRVFGRCVSDEGLKYGSFSRAKNVIPEKQPPKHWDIFVGVDIGSGEDNHPSAIVFLAVNPERTHGEIFKGWRGDDVITTASDVVQRVLVMSAGLKIERIFYDYASRDFYNIAQGMGLPVEAAEKSHTVGEQVLNVLFRNQLLSIYDSAELDPLCVELTTLKASTPKRVAKDDYCDAARYAVTKVEWDWSILNIKAPVEETKPKTEIELRREFVSSEVLEDQNPEAEFEEWNALLAVDSIDHGW